MKPVEIEFLIKNGTKATLEQITTDLNKVGRDGSQSVGATSTAFDNAQRQALILCNIIEQLEGKIKELHSTPADIDQTENIAQIDVLQKKIEELKLHIKQLEEVAEDTQVLPPSMPMAKRQFDGLHFSIQQMAREMPTLAMGPQMFFLAISNNLPIFTDELARARREYAELIKTGQKGTPVWKQVVKSIFSWQTAMTTGIMLLVMYGKELTQSISNMTGWGAAKRAMREEVEKSIEIEKEAIGVAAKTRFELTQTMNSIRTFNGTKDEERQKIDELNSKYGESFGYYQTLAKWYDTLTLKAEEYTKMMFMQAKQQSLLSKSIEAEQQIEEIRKKGKEEYRPFFGKGGKANMFLGGDNLNQYGSDPAELAWKKEMSKLEEERDTYLSDMEFYRNREIEIAKDNSLDQVIEGSVADLEKSIAIRRKALGEITNKAEYDKALAVIEGLEARVRAITGGTNADKTTQSQQDYQAARLASLKKAKSAELDLERSAINDKIKLIEFERDTRIRAIQEEKEAYQKKHGENADTSGFDRQIVAVEQQANTDTQEQIQEDAKVSLIAMQEYLKEYGTFQQKKYAIAEEYALKIKEAQTEGERLSLEKELASYNSNLQAQELNMNIDWGTIFGEFGGMFSEMIEPALADAKKYIKTDQFKNSDEASKQALIEAIAQMEKSLGGSESLNFKQLGVDMQVYDNSLRALNDAKENEAESLEKLKERQKEYEVALKNNSQTEIDVAKSNLENAQINATAASENVQIQTETTNNFRQQVSNTAATLKGGMESILSNVNKIASGSFAGAYEGIVGLMDDLSGAGSAIGKLAKQMDIPVVSWILSLLDALKDGLSNLFGGLLDGVLNAVSGIINDVLSGDLFITIGESISKGVVNIIKSIVTFGGLFGFADDESNPDFNLQADIDRLTTSNERLEKALNGLSDKMDNASISEATSVYKEQLDNLTNLEQNTKKLMSLEAAAWSRFGNGFIGLGGKGSSNKFIDENVDIAEWSAISKLVGRKISSAADFWGLSPEEMAKVSTEAGGIYDKIKAYADDGHKDAAKYMDDYISYAKEREEIEKAYYEKLTNTSFDSVRDEFKNTLLDMKSDAEDFATNFEGMMQDAIIESMMTDKYDEKLKNWYKSFGEAMKGGEMTQKERDALKEEWDNIVKDGIVDRDALKDIFGWESDGDSTTSQSGRAGSFETMSHDQGTKLEGLFTANEIRAARIEEGVESVDVQMSLAVGHLEKIEENTGDCAESLKVIKDDIRLVINDGLKVK